MVAGNQFLNFIVYFGKQFFKPADHDLFVAPFQRYAVYKAEGNRGHAETHNQREIFKFHFINVH